MTLPLESPQQSPQENGQPTDPERYQAVMNFDNISGFDEFDLTKEFAEMKILWDTQNEEKLYAINEQALHEQIQRRGRSVDRTLQGYEWVTVGINLLTAIVLMVSAYVNKETLLLYTIAAAYLAYALVFLFLRRRRRRQDPAFAPTMLGDLDKALWQLNYLVVQVRSITIWYNLPLTIVLSGFLLLRAHWGWALGPCRRHGDGQLPQHQVGSKPLLPAADQFATSLAGETCRSITLLYNWRCSTNCVNLRLGQRAV